MKVLLRICRKNFKTANYSAALASLQSDGNHIGRKILSRSAQRLAPGPIASPQQREVAVTKVCLQLLSENDFIISNIIVIADARFLFVADLLVEVTGFRELIRAGCLHQ